MKQAQQGADISPFKENKHILTGSSQPPFSIVYLDSSTVIFFEVLSHHFHHYLKSNAGTKAVKNQNCNSCKNHLLWINKDTKCPSKSSRSATRHQNLLFSFFPIVSCTTNFQFYLTCSNFIAGNNEHNMYTAYAGQVLFNLLPNTFSRARWG